MPVYSSRGRLLVVCHAQNLIVVASKPIQICCLVLCFARARTAGGGNGLKNVAFSGMYACAFGWLRMLSSSLPSNQEELPTLELSKHQCRKGTLSQSARILPWTKRGCVIWKGGQRPKLNGIEWVQSCHGILCVVCIWTWYQWKDIDFIFNLTDIALRGWGGQWNPVDPRGNHKRYILENVENIIQISTYLLYRTANSLKSIQPSLDVSAASNCAWTSCCCFSVGSPVCVNPNKICVAITVIELLQDSTHTSFWSLKHGEIVSDITYKQLYGSSQLANSHAISRRTLT